MNTAYANTTAAVDFVFWFIAGASVLLLLLVTGLMVFFAVKYHRSRHPQAQETHESTLLEIAWTLIPTALVMVMFWYGYRAFLTMRAVPTDALVVKVTGMMWKWGFEYPNGKKSEVLYVPLNQAVRLNLNSSDVIHGFYIPAFRLKEDVVPGKKNYLWFQPQGMGAADIYCSQFCGLKHAYMMSRVEVLTATDYEAWYTSTNTAVAGTLNLNALPGIPLMQAKGCFVCHRLDGTRGVGPSLLGILGRTETVIENGKEKSVVVDDAYLRRALKEPGTAIVKGYADVMPPVPNLTDNDLQLIVDTLKQLQ